MISVVSELIVFVLCEEERKNQFVSQEKQISVALIGKICTFLCLMDS